MQALELSALPERPVDERSRAEWSLISRVNGVDEDVDVLLSAEGARFYLVGTTVYWVGQQGEIVAAEEHGRELVWRALDAFGRVLGAGTVIREAWLWAGPPAGSSGPPWPRDARNAGR